jgi:FKBP-type peptidyl-prolyl cis-trans isomerase 2
MEHGHHLSAASYLEPGQRVRHPTQPDWGDGQIQSVDGDRVTVNFDNAGKVLVNAAVITLELLPD